MTTMEVLSEIQRLPLSEARRVFQHLTEYLREKEQPKKDLEQREDEFEQYLLAKGIIGNIPTRDETDADDDFEPIRIQGEPLSEMIIRERR